MKSERDEASSATVCAICQSPALEGENKTSCPDCHAQFHADCWEANGGCAVYGCPSVPTIEARSSIEAPVAYWGQEHKLCPSCQQEIMAAAVRCRHCGAVFASAQPVDSLEFTRSSNLKERLPGLKKSVSWLFVFCLLPFSAPFAAVIAPVWRKSHDEDIRSLPALYPALLTIGSVVAAGQTVAMVVVAVLFRLLHT